MQQDALELQKGSFMYGFTLQIQLFLEHLLSIYILLYWM